MKLDIDIQNAANAEALPAKDKFEQWITAVLKDQYEAAQLTVRIVDKDESRHLNNTYRHKNKPTNVLSFPFAEADLLQPPLLGDIAICAPIVVSEAQQQHKDVNAHWAHLIVHGVLHLLGYDHENDDQADEMESREKEILKGLGFADPYQD